MTLSIQEIEREARSRLFSLLPQFAAGGISHGAAIDEIVKLFAPAMTIASPNSAPAPRAAQVAARGAELCNGEVWRAIDAGMPYLANFHCPALLALSKGDKEIFARAVITADRLHTGTSAVKAEASPAAASAAAPTGVLPPADQSGEDIAAAERQASFYNDDDRTGIKTDVMNSFYAGVAYERARPARGSANGSTEGMRAIALRFKREADALWRRVHCAEALVAEYEALGRDAAADAYMVVTPSGVSASLSFDRASAEAQVAGWGCGEVVDLLRRVKPVLDSGRIEDDPGFCEALAVYAQNHGKTGETAARFEVADCARDWFGRRSSVGFPQVPIIVDFESTAAQYRTSVTAALIDAGAPITHEDGQMMGTVEQIEWLAGRGAATADVDSALAAAEKICRDTVEYEANTGEIRAERSADQILELRLAGNGLDKPHTGQPASTAGKNAK